MYVGDDGNLHFTDGAGADTVVPFKKGETLAIRARAVGENYSAPKVTLYINNKQVAQNNTSLGGGVNPIVDASYTYKP